MKKIFVLLITLILTFSIVGCSSKQVLSNTFFEINIENSPSYTETYEPVSQTANIEDVNFVNKLLQQLTLYVNEKYNLNIEKPALEVKYYSPTKNSIVASYKENVIFLNKDAMSEDYTFVIIHELIHYLTDNDGAVGFCHMENYYGIDTRTGYGLTEGLTNYICRMYFKDNNMTIPKNLTLGSYGYTTNEQLATAYYFLNNDMIKWFFASDYISMANFVKDNVEKVAIIPNNYRDYFQFYFYAYQDILMDCSVGNVFDENAFSLSSKSCFEILSMATKASENPKVKEDIEIFIVENLK